MTDASSPSWRLLRHEPADAGWNMAVDETILEGCETDPSSSPTLRLYGWSPAALSIGRNQEASTTHDARVLCRRGFDLVRRATGGQAVLHDDERTYAVIARSATGVFSGGVLDSYLRIAEALAAALRELGADPTIRESAAGSSRGKDPSCFEVASSHEIQIGGRKLIGSAQLHRRGALLQHGSIPFRLDPERVGAVIGRPTSGERFTDLGRVLDGRVGPALLDDALIRAFERRFDVRLLQGGLTPKEALRAEQLRAWKYDSSAWTYRGRLGERERHWGPL